MWRARRGATLLVPSGPAHDPDRMHLHVVLTNPSASGEVLLASVCSIPLSNLYDSSCTLFPGEHPFIAKHSYIAYSRCVITAAATLEHKVRQREFVAKDDLSAARFNDVLVGFGDSPRVALKHRRFFNGAP